MAAFSTRNVGTVVTDRNRQTMAEAGPRARYYMEVNSERREQAQRLFVRFF